MSEKPGYRRLWRALTLGQLVRRLKAMMGEKGVILLVGVPGSGKSTVAEALAAAGLVRLSRDAIRGELFGDEAAQGPVREVSTVFYQRLQQALDAGETVAVDNTNFDRLMRRPVIDLAQRAGYENILLVVMETPLAVCLRGNRSRGREVPEQVITEMHALLWSSEKPRSSEGQRVFLRRAHVPGRYLVHYAKQG